MIEIRCTTQDTLSLDEMTEFQGGLKQREEADFAKIEKSIKKHGFSFPFFVWRHDGINHVLDGHGRLGALNRMVAHGEILPPLPVVYVDCRDEADAKEKLLKLNSTYGRMTADSVRDFLGDLKIDFEELALPSGTLELDATKALQNTVGDDDVPDVDTEKAPVSKRGEVYQLGPHRLMCGDSTSEDDLKALMAGDRADVVFTDPPYGVSIGDKNKMLNSVQKAGRCTQNIANDTLDSAALYEVLVKAFTNLRSLGAAEHCSYYVSSPQGGELAMMMMMMMRDSGLEVRHMLIWVKNTATFSLGRLDYDYRHEPIFYTWTKKHNFYGDYETTVIDDSIPLEKMGKKELVELARKLLYPKPDSVLYEDKPRKCDLHPTMKPVKLVARLIKNSSKEGDIVADIFGGSGTTIIAAAQTGRKARVMELDPHYCDVIRRRWTQWARENGLDAGSGALD